MRKFIIIVTLLFFLHPWIVYADVTTAISVTAAVSPHPSDFQLTMTSNPTSATTIHQFRNIVYTITYGSHLAYATPMTITASWAQGTIHGQSNPSVDILDYLLGSATNAYNNTSPVIDTIHKTITWTIPSLPANTTNQTVSFTLQTNTSYTDTQTVLFPTTAHIDVTGTTVPDQAITMTYQYNPAITPSPTPSLPQAASLLITPTPTTSSPYSITPAETAAGTTPTNAIPMEPTSSIVPIPTLTITNVAIEAISPTASTIQTTINTPATVRIQYGTNLNVLQKTSETATDIEQFITLSHLQPNTRYYFRVIATTGQESTISEVFTFITAATVPTVQIDNSSLIITSGSTLLYSATENLHANLHETIVLPVNKPFQFTFPVSGKNDIKKIEAFIRNNNILGINTFEQQPNEKKITLLEIQPNIYQGLLTTNEVPGMYGLYLHIFDNKGNITEKQLFSIKKIRPLTVLSQDTKNPIHNAVITLYRLDIQTNKYILITPEMFAIKNPSYSNSSGEISYVLQQGAYQVTVTAAGYQQKTVQFRIGSGIGEDYPVIYLQKAKFSITTILDTIQTFFIELASATTAYVTILGTSKAFVFLLCGITLVSFCILSLLSLATRLHTNVFLLVWLLGYRLKQLCIKRTKVVGKVFDEDQKFLLGFANIVIINADKNIILDKTITNAAGEFSFTPATCSVYKVSVEKKGYVQHPFFEFSKESVQSGMLLLPIKKEDHAISIGMYVANALQETLSLSLEVLFVTTFLLEIICGYYIGFLIILPFIVIAFSNVVILITNMHSHQFLPNKEL